MNIRIFLVLMLGGLSSCQIYRSSFDSTPCKGVPCMSVTEIEKMIIETPDGGPDIFLEKSISSYFPTVRNKNPVSSCCDGKIWVGDSCCDGVLVQGHYIYFQNHSKEIPSD